MKKLVFFFYSVFIASVFLAKVSCQITFSDIRVAERIDDRLTIRWSVNGDSLSVEGFRLIIDPATEDGLTEIELGGYDSLVGNEFEYLFVPISSTVTYTVTVHLLQNTIIIDTIVITCEGKCIASPCENGGTCWDDGVDYYCICTDVWAGTTCGTPKNPCDPSPCQNGGVCIQLPDRYICSCPAGSAGTNCEGLVMVPVDGVTIDPSCLSAHIKWNLQTIGLMPEQYEVKGYALLIGPLSVSVMCVVDYPGEQNAVTAECLATNLQRSTTYVYWIDSIHSDAEDPVATTISTFTTTDTPAFVNCPTDVPIHYSDDGSGTAQVYWEEPGTECASGTAFTSRTHFPGVFFDVGTTTVTYQLYDLAVLQDTCAFDIRVIKKKKVPTATLR